MKKAFSLIYLCIISVLICSCQTEYVYTPSGEFYIKTSPANGDAGVQNVISLEAEKKIYEGVGDITVSMNVGFGHLPGINGYGDDAGDTFRIKYRIFEALGNADNAPVWEKEIVYFDSWYDSKYNSTEQHYPPSFIFARYGQFYPLYKEDVYIVFPSGVEKGYMNVIIETLINGNTASSYLGLTVFFTHVNGILTLET